MAFQYAGYCGKLLRVDLTRGVVKEEVLDAQLVEDFIGQAGLAAKMLFDEVPAGISPFSPENKLIFMTGPLTGAPVPCAGRYEVVFKSPQTNGYGEANSGGQWAAELKRSGFDGLIIEGCAASPKFLLITPQGTELKDADAMWGMDTEATRAYVQQEFGRACKVASIGPAGENRVVFAAVINDFGRSAARTGPGAVMGSKNLKAIVVRGAHKPAVADPERTRSLYRSFLQEMKEKPVYLLLSSQGTPGTFLAREAAGYGIVKNWQLDLSEFSGKAGISGEVLNDKYLIKKDACFSCPVCCGRVTRGRRDGQAVRVKGPEYETMAALGSQCLNDDMPTLISANHLCNLFGLDTISTGGVVAFAMECCERGLMPADLLEGRTLSWGASQAMLDLIGDIAYQRGKLGRLLAQGVKAAAQTIGKASEDFAVHVKGVEAAEHDPRSGQGWGLGYSVGNAGARHTEGGIWAEYGNLQPTIGIHRVLDRTTIEEKPEHLILYQNMVASVYNSTGLCYFMGLIGLTHYVPEFIESVTGRRMHMEDIMRCGERSFNVKRVFNAREGFSRKDDALPARFTRDALRQGASKGLTARAGEMLDEYYRLRGWDPVTGWPTAEKLAELSLDREREALYGAC